MSTTYREWQALWIVVVLLFDAWLFHWVVQQERKQRNDAQKLARQLPV